MMRRLRGIISIALVWSLVFAVVQSPVAVLLFTSVPSEQRPQLWPIIIGVTAIWAVAGIVSGAVFAAILVRRARNRALSELSIRRFAWWGSAAGGLAPVLVTPVLAGVGVMPANAVMILALSGVGALVGGSMASSTLWVARRADKQAELASPTHPRAVT